MPQASLDLSSMSFAIAPSIPYALLLIFFSLMTSFAPGNISRTILTVLISGSHLVVVASRYSLKGRLHALDFVLNATKDLLADAQESCSLGAQTSLLFEMTRLHRSKREAKDIRKTIREILEDDSKLKLEREIQNTQQEISNAANLRSRSYPAGSESLES
ncbi:hypothetical protein C8F01DRAFT_1093594 [Mycena amicta]|nr:hypothetical protein C8F01DRAFT_1093594 [Mycena amicta]